MRLSNNNRNVSLLWSCANALRHLAVVKKHTYQIDYFECGLTTLHLEAGVDQNLHRQKLNFADRNCVGACQICMYACVFVFVPVLATA